MLAPLTPSASGTLAWLRRYTIRVFKCRPPSLAHAEAAQRRNILLSSVLCLSLATWAASTNLHKTDGATL
jgi:hypothetical protein